LSGCAFALKFLLHCLDVVGREGFAAFGATASHAQAHQRGRAGSHAEHQAANQGFANENHEIFSTKARSSL
jgi:hypothetical protein